MQDDVSCDRYKTLSAIEQDDRYEYNHIIIFYTDPEEHAITREDDLINK